MAGLAEVGYWEVTPGVQKHIVEKDGVLYWATPDVRECVRAGAGRRFVISDFSQIEVRLIAFLSQEPALIEALNAKKDIHCYMASLCFGEPYELLYEVVAKLKDKSHPRYNELSDMRAGVKTVTFGLPYGAGPPRIASMIRKKDKQGNFIESREDAQTRATELITLYFGNFPEIEFWLREMRKMAQTFGYTTTVLGRRRVYDLPDRSNPEYKKIMSQIGRWAGNQPVQGSSADILKLANVLLYLAHRGGQWTCPMKLKNGIWVEDKVIDANIELVCHDEIVTDAALADVERAQEMLVAAMTDAYNSIEMEHKFRDGSSGTVYLKDIYNKVDAVVADWWAKD